MFNKALITPRNLAIVGGIALVWLIVCKPAVDHVTEEN